MVYAVWKESFQKMPYNFAIIIYKMRSKSGIKIVVLKIEILFVKLTQYKFFFYKWARQLN